jgi:outer membrane lipoprotein
MKTVSALLLLPFLILCGCAHVISEQARSQTDPTLSFAALKASPDSHRGKQIMLGGIVAGVRNTREGGQLEVIQTPLAGNGMPDDLYHSGGRFLAVSAGYLDAAIYTAGRPVTLVGEVKGQKTLPLDETEYTYPVVAIKEIYPWQFPDGDKGYPPVSSWPNYRDDPYYHGYGITPGPWYDRPTGPLLKRWP